MEIGIDSSNPVGLTKNLNFKDTWHVAAGAQYQLDSPWRLNFGVAYDSEFQDSSNVSPLLPANSAWRFGFGAQKQESKTFSWGLAAEYLYGGNLDVNKLSDTPVALGGRGDLDRFVSATSESFSSPRTSTGSSEFRPESPKQRSQCKLQRRGCFPGLSRRSGLALNKSPSPPVR